MNRLSNTAQTLLETYGARHDDWPSAHRVEQAAPDELMAIDRGPYIWPRFKVIPRPQVGDEVSETIGGDYYPQGEIVSISKTYKVITTSTGAKYYRRKKTGTWCRGYSTLVRGHINKLNPEF